jgi:hypothetical protein
MDPFRQGGSPTLEALASQNQGAIPRQSGMLSELQIRIRLERAANVHDDNGSGTLIGGAFFAGLASICGVVIAAASSTRVLTNSDKGILALLFVSTAALVAAARRSSTRAKARRDAAIAELRTWPDSFPFPTDGWLDWLVADRPMLDVVLRDRTNPKTFAEAARAVDGAIEVEVIDELTLRLVLPARTVTLDSGVVRFGDVALADKLFSTMLVPVHHELGIATVHFGGAITDRA